MGWTVASYDSGVQCKLDIGYGKQAQRELCGTQFPRLLRQSKGKENHTKYPTFEVHNECHGTHKCMRQKIAC